MTAQVGQRASAPRPTRRVLAAIVLLAAVVALVIELTRHSPTGGVRAKASLASLTPILPDLDSHQQVVVSHPSCDAYPPCTSAVQTWSLFARSITFAKLVQRVPLWASRNHLRDPQQVWDCGPAYGLFGGSGPGCEMGYAGPRPNQMVVIAVTFTDPTDVSFDPAEQHRIGPANAVAVLGSHLLASLSVQVVGGNR